MVISQGAFEDAPQANGQTDLELLERVAEGDGAAFGVLAERLTPALRRVLSRLGLSETEVEDCLQEALVRIWRSSATFEGRSSVATWSHRIAVNLGISALRSRRAPPPERPIAVVDTEAAWEAVRQAEAVREAVLELPIPLRAVVILREFEGLRYRAIADVLGIPIGTVMSRLHEARARLRRRLAQTM